MATPPLFKGGSQSSLTAPLVVVLVKFTGGDGESINVHPEVVT